MDRSDIAREKLLHELEDADWDISEDMLEHVAEQLQDYFSTLDEAKEFVEEYASALYRRMEEDFS